MPYSQDSAKPGFGSFPYKPPPLSPSTMSSSTIPPTRGYGQSRGPLPQSHKTGPSSTSLGPPSQNPHIQHSTYPYPNNRPTAQTLGEPQSSTPQRGHDSGVNSLDSRAPPTSLSSLRTDRERPAPSPANHTTVPYSHPQFQPHPGLIHSTSPPASNKAQATVPQHNPNKPWKNQVMHTERMKLNESHRFNLY